MSENINLKITAESSDAVRELNKVENAIDGTTKSLKENAKATKENKNETLEFGKSLGKGAIAAAGAMLTIEGLKKVFEGLKYVLVDLTAEYEKQGGKLGAYGEYAKQASRDSNQLKNSIAKLTVQFGSLAVDGLDKTKTPMQTLSDQLFVLSDWVDDHGDDIKLFFSGIGAGVDGLAMSMANMIPGLSSFIMLSNAAAGINDAINANDPAKTGATNESLTGSGSSFTKAQREKLTKQVLEMSGEMYFRDEDVQAYWAKINSGKKPKGPEKFGSAIDISEEDVARQERMDAEAAGGFIFSDQDSADYDKKQAALQKDIDLEIKLKEERNAKLKEMADEMAAHNKMIDEQRVKDILEAEQKKTAAIRAGADAAVTLAEVAGAGEAELAIMKSLIEGAESIASFASGDIAGGIGHAASSVAFAAAAGKGGGGGGSAASGARKKDADVQAQRDKAQKENTMALKEAFSDALKDSKEGGRNITYVINQSGTYLGNDNTSLIKIKETLDGTQRLQFN